MNFKMHNARDKMKVIIPVAGLGTRMLPATKAIPKEMLPVVDKPLIQYVVNECIAAGIKEIILVTHSSKNAIENHFDTSFELEATLEQRVKRQLLEEIKAICPKDVTIMHVRQGESKGLGHAILCAYPLIGDKPFAVVLPDVLLDEVASDLKQDNLARMIRQYHLTGYSQVMVEPVEWNDVSKYGVVDCSGRQISPGNSSRMVAVVEKPAQQDAPSNLAIVGRYVLSPEIWNHLKKTQAGAGGEIQLTDAIATLLQVHNIDAFCLQGRSHDCGDKIGYLKAFVEYSMRHPQLGEEFRHFIAQIQQ